MTDKAEIIARATDHLLWDRGAAIPNVESEQSLADAQHDSWERARDVISALDAAGLTIVGQNWAGIEEMLGSMGPRMRAARRLLQSESRLDHVGIRQAARAIGISPTTYQRVEGGHIPDFKTAKKIMLWLEAMLEKAHE